MVQRKNNNKTVGLSAPKKPVFVEKHLRQNMRKKYLPPNLTLRTRYKEELAEEHRESFVFTKMREK